MPHAQPAKLIEPGKCAFHDPSPPRPGHSHARCGAWPVRARCDMSGDRVEWRSRRSRDLRAHSPAAAAVARVRRAAWELHPPTPGLLASRSDSRRSGEPRAARPARHRSDDACSRVWPDRWDLDRSGHPVHRADGTTVHDRPRPISLVVAREPIQQRKVDQIPHARQLPIAQSPPAHHPRSAPEFLREHLPGNAAAKDEDNAGEARAIRDARPSALWSTGWNRQERFDKIPQRIWK